MREKYDKSSKYLIQHHGNALLFLGGVANIRTWKAVQPEQVQVGQLPDGLLEVCFQRQKKPDYFLVEIATYAERRLITQMVRGTLLVYLDRRVLPEVLTVILRPRGRMRIRGEVDLHSRLDWTRSLLRWRVVELWTLPAEQLLAANQVGLIPWLPLTQFEGPPETLLRECRKRIEEQARQDEQADLLAVTQVMTQLRYNDPGLLAIFGGKQRMIKSPLIQEVVQEAVVEQRHRDILRVLELRFGSVPPDIAQALQAVTKQKRLDALFDHAHLCPDLEAFRTKLSS
jgi:predicted transposase YdaD